MNDRLQHDAAFLFAKQAVALVAHLLREEDRKEVFGEFYRLARDAISRYAEAEERQRKRLRPETSDLR